MEIHGVFSTYKLTNQEKDLFAEYLQHVMNNPVIEFVRYLLGDDYLKFIDILSGTTFKIPSSKSLEKDLESVRIYIYVSKGGFTEESIKSASKIFGKTVLTTRRYTYKVCRGKEEYIPFILGKLYYDEIEIKAKFRKQYNKLLKIKFENNPNILEEIIDKKYKKMKKNLKHLLKK